MGAVAEQRGPGFTPSPEQQRIISHRGGHLQVIACAGSGKTEAISSRVAELILEGVLPEEIVAFAFTERAAASLKARVLVRVAEKLSPAFLGRLGPMYVGTIHSYCFRLLQDHVPSYANYDVLDEHRQAALLSREYRRLGLDRLDSRHWKPIRDFLRNADVIENELIDPARISDTDLGGAYTEYCATLRRYRFLTYGQLVTAAIQALRDPVVHKLVHGRLKHLLVDEYQDINPAQEELIRLLAQPPVELCVVGDDDQAIYQWRGSDVTNIQKFTQRYQGAGTLPLADNRRSRPGIIEAANRVSGLIWPRLVKRMKPKREPAEASVHSWTAETPEEEAATLAETIRGLIERGYRYRDVAVLLRSVRTSSGPIIEAFQRERIPFRCAGRTGLFLQPEAQLLGMTYAWLSGNNWKAERFGRAGHVELANLIELYERLFEQARRTRPALESHLYRWQEAASADREPVNLVREYYRWLRQLGVHQWDLGDPETAARMGCLAGFSGLLADFEHVTRRSRWVQEDDELVFRGGQSRGPWCYKRLFNYIQFYALDAYEEFEGEESFDLDAVNILTVHQAKGLEWPVVFIPCLVRGRFPSRFAGRSEPWALPLRVFVAAARARYQGGVADERRLFYVAVTRAREMLYLSWFRRIQKSFQPSKFLLDVAGTLPRPGQSLPLPPPSISRAHEPEEKPTLAFSDVADYAECPLSFRFGRSFGFEPQLVPELGYGKAIHQVLRAVADHVRATARLPTASEVELLLAREFYLPFAHQHAFLRLREQAARLLRRYLARYSNDLFRVWEAERPFELHLASAVITGRADVILDREGGINGSMALVDYKTAHDEAAADKYAFQLAIYAAAARGEGIDVQAAYVHDLAAPDRVAVPVSQETTEAARRRAAKLVAGMLSRSFEPSPAPRKCGGCDYRFLCRHGRAQ